MVGAQADDKDGIDVEIYTQMWEVRRTYTRLQPIQPKYMLKQCPDVTKSAGIC